MRLLVGMPVYERAWILPAWFEHAKRNRLENVQVVAAYTPSKDETGDILRHWKANVITVTEGVHGTDRDWTNPQRIQTLANMRNLLLDWAISHESEWDYYLSLDSDVLMGSIGDLILHIGDFDVVSPRVQLGQASSITNAFVQRKDGWLRRVAPDYGPCPMVVDVVCAAKLMTKEVVREVRYDYHPRGEDFAFAQDAKAKGYEMGWCGNTKWTHVMDKRSWVPEEWVS